MYNPKVNTELNKKVPRAPVVVVLGHIDHGKSSLLDYIRKTNTVDKEHGGITQHIKAYEASFGNHKITFVDTPGHEAFLSVRKRGSNIADIAILIISAEDGVKPQTVESIKCIKESGVPYLVAINKIDKPGANIDKIKQSLAEHEVLVEGWGGNVPLVPVSAKTGEGVNELLETLVLLSEVEGVSGNPVGPADGFIIESEKDAKKGISSALIIKNGVLKKGMFVVAGGAVAPVRSMEDSHGKELESASLSKTVEINGWTCLPPVGLKFRSFEDKREAEAAAAEERSVLGEICADKGEAAGDRKLIPLIVRADTIGSLEAVKSELYKLNTDRVVLKIIQEGIGNVSLNDVKTAIASKGATILGFNAKTDPDAKDVSVRNEVEIMNWNVIYDLLDWMKERIAELTPQEKTLQVAGKALILKTFSKSKSKQVLGARAEEGVVERDSSVKILRREAEIGEGKIKELQTQKIKTGKVEAGSEFGVLIDSKVEIAPGDRIVSYKFVSK